MDNIHISNNRRSLLKSLAATSLRTLLLPITLIATLTLTACGGGGGGGTPVVPSGPTYTIGGTISGLGVARSVVLQNNGGNNLTLSANGTFTFSAALNDSAVYAVTVLTQPAGQTCAVATGSGSVSGTNVTAVAVNCTNLPSTAKAWGNGIPLEANNGNATIPKIAIDASGNAIAVWEQVRVTNLANDVWSSRYIVGLGWSTPAVIPRLTVDDPASGPSENSRNPDIAMDASGNAIAVWRQPGSGEGVFNIWSSRYTVGSGWGSRELIGENGPANYLDPKIAIDASGNALAVWRHDGGFGIGYNRYTAGSGWASPATPTLIGGLDNGSLLPIQLAMSASGDAMVVWSQDGDSNPSVERSDIWSSRYTAANNTWGAPELVETDNTGRAGFPEIAIDASGNALAVWHQAFGTRTDIFANRYINGTGWGTPVLLETDNTSFAIYPKIAMDADGNAIAMWFQRITTTTINFNYYSSRYIATSNTWGTPVIVGNCPTSSTCPTNDHQIAVNASGNAVAVWTMSDQYDPDTVGFYPFDLWSNRYTVGTGWGTAEYVKKNFNSSLDSMGNEIISGDDASTPKVVIDTSGNILVVWNQATRVPNVNQVIPDISHIWFNRFE